MHWLLICDGHLADFGSMLASLGLTDLDGSKHHKGDELQNNPGTTETLNHSFPFFVIIIQHLLSIASTDYLFNHINTVTIYNKMTVICV